MSERKVHRLCDRKTAQKRSISAGEKYSRIRRYNV